MNNETLCHRLRSIIGIADPHSPYKIAEKLQQEKPEIYQARDVPAIASGIAISQLTDVTKLAKALLEQAEKGVAKVSKCASSMFGGWRKELFEDASERAERVMQAIERGDILDARNFAEEFSDFIDGQTDYCRDCGEEYVKNELERCGCKTTARSSYYSNTGMITMRSPL